MRRRIVCHLGPTNSGKTYHALQALKAARSGVYCGPLRLLAWEIAERLNGAAQGTEEGCIPCNLITGQELQLVPNAHHTSSTVEMVDVTRRVDVGVLDEIQCIADPDRGFAWTRVLLGLPAAELHCCGDPSALPIVRELCRLTGDELVVKRYERLAPLTAASSHLRSFSHVQRGDCVVAFSRRDLFKYKEKIERATGLRCGIIYGSLPPAVRREEARRFNRDAGGAAAGSSGTSESNGKTDAGAAVSAGATAHTPNDGAPPLKAATGSGQTIGKPVPVPKAASVQVFKFSGQRVSANVDAVAQGQDLHDGDDDGLGSGTGTREPTDVLVATDAIGMGLNLAISRVILAKTTKFDGISMRRLTVSELKQIAGRAGRYGGAYGEAGGVATAADAQSLHMLRRALKTATPLLRSAGVQPQLEHLELFAASIVDAGVREQLVEQAQAQALAARIRQEIDERQEMGQKKQTPTDAPQAVSSSPSLTSGSAHVYHDAAFAAAHDRSAAAAEAALNSRTPYAAFGKQPDKHDGSESSTGSSVVNDDDGLSHGLSTYGDVDYESRFDSHNSIEVQAAAERAARAMPFSQLLEAFMLTAKELDDNGAAAWGAQAAAHGAAERRGAGTGAGRAWDSGSEGTDDSDSPGHGSSSGSDGRSSSSRSQRRPDGQHTSAMYYNRGGGGAGASASGRGLSARGKSAGRSSLSGGEAAAAARSGLLAQQRVRQLAAEAAAARYGPSDSGEDDEESLDSDDDDEYKYASDDDSEVYDSGKEEGRDAGTDAANIAAGKSIAPSRRYVEQNEEFAARVAAGDFDGDDAGASASMRRGGAVLGRNKMPSARLAMDSFGSSAAIDAEADEAHETDGADFVDFSALEDEDEDEYAHASSGYGSESGWGVDQAHAAAASFKRHFFFCEHGDMVDVAKAIDDVPLPFRARYIFTCAPV